MENEACDRGVDIYEYIFFQSLLLLTCPPSLSTDTVLCGDVGRVVCTDLSDRRYSRNFFKS